MADITVVFVHGWSVTEVSTYGELPLRLRAEAAAAKMDLEIKEIFLGKYISFHDEVKLSDISTAFQAAAEDQLASQISSGQRFVCITHSTGGPVIRDWWFRFHKATANRCPMSHLIMLAPANFGSALAQLGKARVGRLKSWTAGIDPGQRVLDWLELGSEEAWKLNVDWITSDGSQISDSGIFPFVLTGQYIDRAIYDHLNNYTGELGSDGVVRVAAANLESRIVKLKQEYPKFVDGKLKAELLTVSELIEGPKAPLRIITNKSHSDKKMGIMNSVKREIANDQSAETLKAILDCLRVKTKADYDALYNQFTQESAAVQDKERVEIDTEFFLFQRPFIHDRFSMVIFRLIDTEGNPVKDYDLIITAGDSDDPNHLPDGFFKDKQRNKLNNENLTYFINYDVVAGMDPVKKDQVIYRPKLDGIDKLGIKIDPRPQSGFVHYLPCSYQAHNNLFKALKPNSTTLVEICMQRVVHKNVFQLEKLENDVMPNTNFKKTEPGPDIT